MVCDTTSSGDPERGRQSRLGRGGIGWSWAGNVIYALIDTECDEFAVTVRGNIVGIERISIGREERPRRQEIERTGPMLAFGFAPESAREVMPTRPMSQDVEGERGDPAGTGRQKL